MNERGVLMAKCSRCGGKLNGIPQRSRVEISKLSKSMKQVSRLCAGSICHNCVAQMIKAAVRGEAAKLTGATGG